MEDHAAEFAEPFRKCGFDLSSIYYFGESVLLPQWRGRGIGHAFFDGREAAARERGFTTACFCAVIRPIDHPMKPAEYRPLDQFWRKRGYSPVDGLVANFEWDDLSDGQSVKHPMQFWLKTL